jgi:hypothetical protein
MERITQNGYEVKVHWENWFGFHEDMEVEESLLSRTRDDLYEGKTLLCGYITKRAQKVTITDMEVVILHPGV